MAGSKNNPTGRIHKLKIKFLPAIALAIICSVLVSAQQGNKASDILRAQNAATATQSTDAGNKKDDKISLTLTDTEKLDLANLANVAQQLDGALNARLKAILEISCGNNCDEPYVIGLAVTDARKFYREQLQPATERYSKRLAEIQKAHGCEGCGIDKGVFVKAAK